MKGKLYFALMIINAILIGTNAVWLVLLDEGYIISFTFAILATVLFGYIVWRANHDRN